MTTTVAATLPFSRSVGRCSSSSVNACPAGEPGPGRACGAGCASAASRCGQLLDHLAQDRPRQARHGEVAADGAVGVVVQGQPCLLQRGVLLLGQQRVLVRVDRRLVVLDRSQRPAGGLAQARRVERLRLLDQRLRPSPAPRPSPSGSVGRATITCACSGDTAPASSAVAVAGRSSSRAVARRTSRAASAPPALVCTASQALVPGIPASRPESLGLVGRGHQLQLQRLQPGHRAVAVGDHGGVPTRRQRRGGIHVVEQAVEEGVEQGVDLAHRGDGRVAGVGVEVQ